MGIARCGPVKEDSGGGVLVFGRLAGIELAETIVCAWSLAKPKRSPPGVTKAALAFAWLSQGVAWAVCASD
jgi:hypothetical protein